MLPYNGLLSQLDQARECLSSAYTANARNGLKLGTAWLYFTSFPLVRRLTRHAQKLAEISSEQPEPLSVAR